MDDIQKLIDLSIHYRGSILDRCITLENEIDGFIAFYFAENVEKYNALLEIVIDRMTFDAKIATLEEILKRESGANYDKKYGKLISELRYIKMVRNNFAHLRVHTGYQMDDKIPKEFSLVNSRNGVEIKTFSKGEYSLFIERTDRCIDEVAKYHLIRAGKAANLIIPMPISIPL
jgi:K+ transporter